MELSLNILFYFEHRGETKIISHKTESFYFHQNIWKSYFIFNLDYLILGAGAGLETGFGYYLKHSFHKDTIYFKKCQTSQKLPVKAVVVKS